MRRARKGDPLAEAGIRYIDYKDEKLLGRFLSERGKILPRNVCRLPFLNRVDLAVLTPA